MTDHEGIKEIDAARWQKDYTDTLNLFVTDKDGHPVHAWLTRRPAYCDRGHIQLNIDGRLGLDDQDSFPRFFFTFKEADQHCRMFLKWRLWKVRSVPVVAEWGPSLLEDAEIQGSS